jgi:hypothetical protein
MSPVEPTLPAAKIGRRPMCSPMLTGFRSSSLSTWRCGNTTSSSRRLGASPAAVASPAAAPSTSRNSETAREAMTCSGPTPYQASAAGRMKWTPLPEQIQTEKSWLRSSAISSFIG